MLRREQLSVESRIIPSRGDVSRWPYREGVSLDRTQQLHGIIGRSVSQRRRRVRVLSSFPVDHIESRASQKRQIRSVDGRELGQGLFDDVSGVQ